MSEQDHTTPVEYRDIPGYPGYRVGSDGSVWSCRRIGKVPGLTDTWRQLSPVLDCLGYHSVRLCKAGVGKTFRIHTLVLTAFVGPKPDGCEALHGDGTRTNNRLKNLRWGTRSDNMKDAVRHGTHVRTLESGRRTLRRDQIPVIRRMHAEGKTQEAIGREFGVSQTCISSVLRGKTWGYA